MLVSSFLHRLATFTGVFKFIKLRPTEKLSNDSTSGKSSCTWWSFRFVSCSLFNESCGVPRFSGVGPSTRKGHVGRFMSSLRSLSKSLDS